MQCTSSSAMSAVLEGDLWAVAIRLPNQLTLISSYYHQQHALCTATKLQRGRTLIAGIKRCLVHNSLDGYGQLNCSNGLESPAVKVQM